MNHLSTHWVVVVVAVLGCALGAARADLWSHGFEGTDSPGSPDYGWDHDPYSYVFAGTASAGPVSAVSSGLDAAGNVLAPQAGSQMGAFGTTDNVVQLDPLGPFPAIAQVGPATSFNEASFSGAWPTVVPGIETHMDVYLDVNWQDGSGFCYSTAVSAYGTPIQHRRDFVFDVYKGVDASSDVIYIEPANGTDYTPSQQIVGSGYEITTSGWYRFDYDFNEVTDANNPQGYLEVTMQLQPGGGGLALETWVLPSTDDIIDSAGIGPKPRTVGGRNYGWFPFIDITNDSGSSLDLYVDNVHYSNPEPATLAVLTVGGLAMLRRRRRSA